MIALVLGGAKSGKSEMAERLAARLPEPVTYLAVAFDPEDADMAARVAAHRARRPPGWATVEVQPGGDLASVLMATAGTALVDSLGTWLTGADGFAVDAERLARALVERAGDAVVVSDEVGLGVHPSTELGRRFRDALGELNRRVAEVADPVLLVVAGRVLKLPGEQPNTAREPR